MWKRWMPILIPQDPVAPSPHSLLLWENVWETMGYPIGEYFLQFEDTRVDMADDQTGKQENEIKSTLIRRFLCGIAIGHTTHPLLCPLKSFSFFFSRILSKSCGVHENMQLLKSTNFALMTRTRASMVFIVLCLFSQQRKEEAEYAEVKEERRIH